MRNIVIERAHDTHPGVQATKNMVNLKSWWPGVGKDVEKFIIDCSECAKIRPRTEKSIDTWPDPQLWEKLHIDWAYIQEVGNILIFFRRWFWLDRSVHRRQSAHGRSHTLFVRRFWEN